MNKKINLLIFIFNFIVITYTILIFIKGIGFVIEGSFNKDLYRYDSLLEILSSIFTVHSGLLIVPLWLMLTLFFKRNLRLYNFSIALCLSFFINSYELLDKHLHPFLESLHIYDYFLREGQVVLNPQFTKILLYIVSIIIMFFICLDKKKRTMDRVFILLISLSVIMTTIIFHITIPMGYFKFIKNEQQILLVNNFKSSAHLKDFCIKKDCLSLNKTLEITNIISGTDFNFNNHSYFKNRINKFFSDNNSNSIYSDSLGSFEGQKFDYILTAVMKDKDDYIVVMDDKVLKPYARQSEIWFCFLSSLAHFVWIYGGILLLFIHKKRFLKRK